jgi:NAD(P)-dependent dehydrogenase (short-subunit alcohol dehydrogenase family)
VTRLADKVVLITGAASGIGRASCLRVASEGARAVCVDLQREAVEQAAKEIREAGGEATAIACDVSDKDAVQQTIDAAVAQYGQLDSLCNSAGILSFGHTHEFPLERWQQILDVNLTGTFLMCQAALPHLLNSGGSIINISSTAALRGQPWSAAYAASKGGVLSLTYALAVEYGKQGVRANAICPGSVATPMHEAFELPEGADAGLLRRIMPLDTFRGPEVIASLVALLASEDSAHMNGEYLRADGGALS